MVAPVRDIGNKFFYTSAISTMYSNITLPALADIDINIFNIGINDNYDNIREHIVSSKMNIEMGVLLQLIPYVQQVVTLWTIYIGVHSFLFHYSTAPCVILMYDQSVPYTVVEAFLFSMTHFLMYNKCFLHSL